MLVVVLVVAIVVSHFRVNKKNQFSGTLWEIYDSEDPELDNTYTLDYIYSTT